MIRLFFFFFFLFSSSLVFSFTLERWPGSGYPVLAYKKEKTTIYEKPNLDSSPKEIETLPKEIVDFGLTQIISKKYGKLKSKKTFYLTCKGKKDSIRIQKEELITVLYMNDRTIITNTNETPCEFIYKETDPLLFFDVLEPVESEWWIQIHSSKEIEKVGWAIVNDENFTQLPRLPANNNHNNRRGITGSYSYLKAVSFKEKPHVNGYFNHWEDYDVVKKEFKERCFFFFQGDQVGDFYDIEIWSPKENKKEKGKLKYHWRANKSYLMLLTEKELPGCNSKKINLVNKPLILPLVHEGIWKSAAIVKEQEVDLMKFSNHSNKTGYQIKKYEPLLILQSFDSWVLVEAFPPRDRRGWLEKNKLYQTSNLEDFICKEFDEIPGIPTEYQSLVCNANLELDKKQYEKAIAFYEQALEQELKDENENPIPNYKLYKEIADLRCLQKKEVESSLIRKDLLCMEQVVLGIIPCFNNQRTQEEEKQLNPNQKISKFCFTKVCKKSFVKNYTPFPGTSQESIAKIRELKKEILVKCSKN